MTHKIFILTALISLTTLSAKADLTTSGTFLTQSRSDVSVTPDRLASCETQPYLAVNRIFGVEIHENDSMVVVSFQTEYGPCGHAYSLENVHSKIIGDAFYGFFDKYPADSLVSISEEDPTLGRVELTFDKKRIFKKTTVATFAFSLITLKGLEFRWTVKLTQLPDNTTLFQLQ